MESLIRLRRFLDSRLQPPYIVAASGLVIGMGLLLSFALFLTANRGRTAFGIPLGADFAGFYVAAEILNLGKPQQLYDRKLHDHLYHELLPDEDDRASIPYVHPPFVAGLFRPLALLPYPVAVGIWLVISASLYLLATSFFLKALPWQPLAERRLILLLIASFEPFLFECWLGGQLSSIAFFSHAVSFIAMQRGKPLWAGMALGICLYKPTLLILTLPLLVIGRRWQMLLGMVYMGMALGVLSLLLVGWQLNANYVNVLLSFQQSATGGDIEIRTWKYVDLNNCLRLVIGNSPPLRLLLMMLIGLFPCTMLGQIWWDFDKLNEEQHRVLWATTLTWVPVLNLYFGIYDSVLVVQSLLITAVTVRQNDGNSTPLVSSGLAYLILAFAVVPWFSQGLASTTGVSAYTLLLMGLGTYQFGRFFGLRPWARQLRILISSR